MGRHDSPGRDRGVREALKGWGRRLARPQRQAGALTADVLAVIRLTAPKPRARGRGFETAEQAAERARFDLALVAVLSDGGLRRSEAAALTWGDVQRWDDGSGRITVIRSKTRRGDPGRPHPRDRAPEPLETGRRHGRPLHPRRDRRVGPPVFIIDVWHLFGEVVRRFSRVDVRLTGVGEHQEAAVQVQVDAGRLGVIVVNDDAPFGSLLTNGAVTECH